MALPVAIGSAVFLTEIAPARVARPVGFLIEMLAATLSNYFYFHGVRRALLRQLDRPDEAWLGVGEGMVGPTAAAIANAVCNAMGVRVRDMPITRERILAAME